MAQSSFALRIATLASCAATFGLAACSTDSVIPTAAPSASASRDAGGAPNGGDGSNGNNGNAFANGHVKVCAAPPAGEAGCHSWITVDDKGQPLVTSGPTGFNPADLQAAYQTGTAGTAVTVAIVDAYDDPNAESDLAVYRAKFGLPACTTANGCFKKVNQNGGPTPPKANASWAEEISLDLDMVSAICPACHILLVEASSNSFANLAAAEDQAASDPTVVAISNSYGGGEYSGELSDQSHFNHPPIAITVSSGDNGYGVEFPAASQYVTAVGGTSLTKNGSTFTETAWSGAGSGCSALISKPSWQQDTGCSRRTVADVSAVANPSTGVSVYDTYGIRPRGGWLVFGGTSVAAPIIGAVYALANNLGANTYGSLSYGNTTALFDVKSGSNGSCGGSYLCTAGTGYDGPTGNGSPRGTGAF
jgi:subtilase family serine protease